MRGPERKPFYSPTEYARLIGVDPSTVMDWIHGRRLFALRLGPKTYRIPLAVVLRQLEPDRTRPQRVALDRRELTAAQRGSRRRTAATSR